MVALPWRVIAWHFLIAFFAIAAFSLLARMIIETPLFSISTNDESEEAPREQVPFVYEFSDPGILHEAAARIESSSPYWWLDSGAKLVVDDGTGKTLQGRLPASDGWHDRYERTSAEDTSKGSYPQNLFRLLTIADWENVRTEAAFRVVAYNRTDSPNRNESNGILLMSRYRDGNNLYYAGLRVDGHAVIKKKYDGRYYTMIELPVIDGTGEELLPLGEWMTLGMETRNDGDVVLIVLSRKNADGSWEELVRASDHGQLDGTEPITGSYPVGIRTDFMDVEFDDFKAQEI